MASTSPAFIARLAAPVAQASIAAAPAAPATPAAGATPPAGEASSASKIDVILELSSDGEQELDEELTQEFPVIPVTTEVQPAPETITNAGKAATGAPALQNGDGFANATPPPPPRGRR